MVTAGYSLDSLCLHETQEKVLHCYKTGPLCCIQTKSLNMKTCPLGQADPGQTLTQAGSMLVRGFLHEEEIRRNCSHVLVVKFGVLVGYVLSDKSVKPVQQQATEILMNCKDNSVLKTVKMINLALNHLYLK